MIKKKDIPDEDKKIWDEYTKSPFDIYDKDAFIKGIELIWPKIINGGIFIVSAYGSISLDSLTDAVDNYCKDKQDCVFFQSFSGLAILFKQIR